jgi:DHA1 family tetracycline resistance protein-like MFS transporter
VFDKRLYVVFLIVFTEILGFTLVLPVIPFLGLELGLNAFEIGLIVSVFSFSQLFASPITGKLSDKFGRKPLLILSQLSTLAGFLLLGFASTVIILLLARLIDGLLGSNMTVSQAYICDITPPQHRTRAYGYYSGIFGAALIVGPILGGVLSTINYSVPMFFGAGITLISIFLVILFLPETITKKTKKITLKLNDILPIKDAKQFFKTLKVRKVLTMFFIYNLAFFVFISVFSLFAEAQFQIDASQAGWYLGWIGLIRVIIQTVLITRILKAIGEENALKTGIVAMIFSMVGLAFSVDYLIVFIPLVFLAYGTGIIRPVLLSKLTNSVSKKQTATILGVNNSLTSVVQIITPIVGGLMISYLPLQTLPLLSASFFILLLIFSKKQEIKY